MATETIKIDGAKSSTTVAEAKTVTKTRLDYIDILRVALTMLVVAHHAAQAYGPTGGSWPITNPTISPILGPFFAVNAMFFMGLFFLISGYFVPRSFDRKGGVGFMKGRATRLLIPALFFGWLIFAPLIYLAQGESMSLVEYVQYMYGMSWQLPYIHLWFLLHLVLYSAGYFLWRQTRMGQNEKETAVPLPTTLVIIAFILALALVSFVVRIWYPIDRWAALFWLIPAEIAHLPQYVALFALGILAYRGDWLSKFPTRSGTIWLGIGLLAAAAYYVYSIWGAQWFYETFGTGIIATGGLDWRSLVFCLWEAVVCVGLCIGFLILFRERLNKNPGRLLLAMIGAAYTVYIIHWWVVVGIQAGFESVDLEPFIKFVVVAILAIALSFMLGVLIKKIPGAKKFL